MPTPTPARVLFPSVTPRYDATKAQPAAWNLPLKQGFFDLKGFRATKQLREKLHIASLGWAFNGFGAPAIAHVFYFQKQVAWYFGWRYFAKFGAGAAAPGLAALLTFDGLQRLVLWNMFFEALGLGCGSGALTGRLTVPFTAPFHFLWPGTIKLPWRADSRDGVKPFLPWASNRRSVLDVLLYVSLLGLALRALTSPAIGLPECAPIAALLGYTALNDTTIFMAARSEVYGYMTLCFCALGSAAPTAASTAHVLTALKVVQLGIWIWSSVSKWGPWFPYAVQVMMCNSPTWPLTTHAFHKALFTKYPTDLTASLLCKLVSYFGVASELLFPLALACGGPALTAGGSPLLGLGALGLFVALGFHVFILSQVAMAVPQEWNLFTMINATFLFGLHGGLSLAELRALPGWLKAFLLVVELAVPLLGNVSPKRVCFLVAHRYYAGNWPVSIYVVKKSAVHKLQAVPSCCGHILDQACAYWGTDGVDTTEAKLLGWFALHLQGRLLPKLIPLTIGDDAVEDYHFMNGEASAGLCLGYNFGCGYQHGTYLLNAMQERCHFKPGELRCILIDPCPTFGSAYPWAIKDATDAHGAGLARSTEPRYSKWGVASTLDKTQPY